MKREELYDKIQEIVVGNSPNAIPQHVLISGKEGMGKSFFLAKLSRSLSEKGYVAKCIAYPHSCMMTSNDILDVCNNMQDGGRKVMLVDDFDKMLAVLPTEDQYKLRAFLFAKNAPTLVATSTGIFEGFTDYRKPFYDAFMVFHLPELTNVESLFDTESFRREESNPDFQNALQLFGDNLGYVALFAKALGRGEEVTSALRWVMECNERYFKFLFATFPVVQQRTLFGLAQIGHEATSSEIAQSGGLSSTNTSSALFRLEKQGIVCKVGDKKRNANYCIVDRVFAKWLAH